jgi:polysaccharide pyruvyl transferase CsaB
MRDLLVGRGFDPNRVFTIYNGVEFSGAPAADAGDRRAFLRDLGWDVPEDAVVVGIAARFHPVKDLPTLLRGFAAAYGEHPQLRLLIAGDGQDRAALEELAAQLGIASVTHFAGWVRDMPAFYRALDVNTLTSRSETFPYAITEGARAHLPTVSSRVGGVPALIRAGETGLLFTPGDDRALGAHLAALAASPALRRQLGDALYRKANAEFSAEATCRTQLDIYDRILRTEARLAGGGRYGALVCGAYGMRNAGDEAILRAVVSELRSIDPERPIAVLTRLRAETRQSCGVRAIHSFDLPRILRAMQKSELFVNGGGSLIQDVTSTRSLLYYLYMLRAAKRRGCRVMMYGCGIGPVRRAGNRRRAAKTINGTVDAITLREPYSEGELRAYGVDGPEVVVASDPALSLAPADADEVAAAAAALGMEPEARYFCLCVRRWPEIREKLPLFATAADYASERYGLRPLLLCINPQQDREVLEQLRSHIRAACLTVTEELTPALMIGLMERMTLVMSMRLHLLIFAASRAVPLAGISYDPKVAAFLDEVSPNCCLGYSALRGTGQLTALIDAALAADRGELRARTGAVVALERRNVEVARRLLGD